MGWKQALYKLNNPEKYIGDERKLKFKSSWEEKAFMLCDNNPNIIRWGYEIIPISYMKPLGNNRFKPSKYYPDLYVEYYNKSGDFIKEIVEIKPLKQTKKSRARKPEIRLQENYTHLVNMTKWQAAEAWCNHHGIKFSVATEKSIFGRK